MLKPLLLSALSLLSLQCLIAQDFVQISTGAGYNRQSFYSLSSDQTQEIALISWDLAFSTIGSFDAAIHINEGAGSGAEAKPALEFYNANTTDFAAVIDPQALGDRIWNDERSWEFGGLNSVALENDPFDYGWGSYNPGTHALDGTRVFVVKLRDASYKKFKVQSMAGGVYTLVFANLDGSAEQTATIKKADYKTSGIALFSFSTGAVTEDTPSAAWDMSFTRYVTPLDDGTGTILDYPVTGILSGPGIQTVKAEGIDPETVNHLDYLESLTPQLDVIGYDWKAFDFTQGWLIPEDVVYFVKTRDNHLWKIRFIDFEGSSTGTGTFEKTDLGLLASVKTSDGFIRAARVFPNPVVEQAHLVFTSEQAISNVPVQLFNMQGQSVWSARKEVISGTNAWTLPALDLAAGVYFLQLGSGSNSVTLPVQY